METLLSLDAGDIPVILSDLTSLVSIEADQGFDGPVSVLRVFHASLGDFLFDASRSKQFWINAPLRHAEFTVLHLKDVPGSMFRLNNLRCHFQGAAPTPELQEAIAEFSVASHLAELGAPGFIPYFFAVISKWNIDDAADLYDEQLRRFDHFAKGLLRTIYAEPRLTALASILQLEVNKSSDLDILFVLFSLRKSHRRLDKLSFLYWVHISPDYRRFILEFLEDPRRSGIYTFTGKRYATAAVYFIKYISNHLEQITPTFSTLKRKYIQQRNTPWLWHKIVQKTRSSEAAQIGRWQVLNKGLGWGSTIMLNSDRAFGLALRCLAHVLPRSERSDELTTLARRHTFGPLSRKYPYRKRAMRREIARYLARVEQEGG
ncbi:hypothetical protein GALMADRAFT_249627 [Galerina marginata CBS 339.88]|uniref:Uncharacterized protein n=1 Tax=Galerina marginata (strain CBS 339.88) TaxID=685588 RepID=A0A067SXE1_GALM3|nr:hypothetical protein GALMADRAFT_249627 [Galerina marginata CBS 339.88]